MTSDPTATLEIHERLDPAHEETVRATLPLVGAHIEQIAPTFYGRMFAAHPELLRDTFNRGNQAQGAQQKALAASVATYATLLVDPDGPSPREMLGRIGHKHASLGITEDQYGIVHEHLMAAIVEVLGADVVTTDVAAAWDAVYWHMARTLIDFEHELYRGADVAPGDVFRTVRVAERVDESRTVASFVLEAREGDPELGGFVPGQYVSVGVHLPDGARQLRQYSLSDAPGDGRWRISVKRIDGVDGTPDGEVSSFLHETLEAGDELQVTLPFGDLTLDTASKAPVVLVSAGIGATPILGMARHLAAHQPGRTAVVAHADVSAEQAALVEELAGAVEVLARETPSALHLWFERGTEHTESLPGSPRVRAGRMDLTGLELPADAEIYLCGGSGFLQAVRGQLREAGADEARVHYELFSPNDWLLPGA